MKDEFKIILKNIKTTNKLAKILSFEFSDRILITLKGPLGCGKTTFSRFFINYYSKKKIYVTSPTFPLVNLYDFPSLRIWHYDLYRLKNKKEIFSLDFEDALRDIVIIEWPEIIDEFLPKNRLEIEFFEKDGLRAFIILRIFGEIKLKDKKVFYEKLTNINY